MTSNDVSNIKTLNSFIFQSVLDDVDNCYIKHTSIICCYVILQL